MPDPNGWIQNPPSTFVKVVNTSRETLNGRFGLCLQYSEEKGRYTILLVPLNNGITVTSANEQVALKTENLVVCTFVEKYQAQYALLRYNPEIQAQIQKVYTTIQNRTGGIKPEYVLIGLLALIIVAIYFIGFSKVLLVLAGMMVLFSIIGQDLLASVPMETVLRNAPNRWKSILRDQIPFGYGSKVVDNKYSYLAVTALIVFLFIFPLFTTSTSKASTAGGVGNTLDLTTTLKQGGGIPTSYFTSDHIEKLYKLGFDDATSSMEYGTSLPKSISDARTLLEIDYTEKEDTVVPNKKVAGAATATTEFDIDDSYILPSVPAPKSKSIIASLLNFQTAMSLFMIYRTIEPISKNSDGNFDLDVLKANLGTLDVWKLGILGFSVYRLVSQFL